MSKKRLEKKRKKAAEYAERTCETCDNCVYIGEGDFICDRNDEPELVIEDWTFLREPCRKWVEK